MTDNAVAKALHDGLDRLRERGWTKHMLCDEATGRVCARGALYDSTPNRVWGRLFNDVIYEADELLSEIAVAQYPDRTFPDDTDNGVVWLNNHPDTTQEDVERVFEKAIVKAYEVA